VTYTYDNTDLSTDLAKVRSAIGDVEEHPHYSLTDEEIAVHTSAAPTLAIAKYLAARDRLARMVQWSTRNAATVTADRNGVVNAMKELKEELLRDAGGTSAVSTYSQGNIQVQAGMLSQDDLDTAATDNDYPGPQFEIGQDDNPNLGESNYSKLRDS
jgi:hypothetical protein